MKAMAIDIRESVFDNETEAVMYGLKMWRNLKISMCLRFRYLRFPGMSEMKKISKP